MNTTIISTEDDMLTLTTSSGLTLVYSPETDCRVADAVDGKIFTNSKQGALELAAEMNAWGVPEARAFEYAVVFWG